MVDMINEMSDEDISSSTTKIEIKDDEGTSQLLNDRLKKYELNQSIPSNITEEADRQELSNLEAEKAKLKNQKTQSARNRESQIDERIKQITDKYPIETESVTEEAVEETPAIDDSKSRIQELEKEKETLKKEGDELIKKYDELVSQGKDVEASAYFEENLQPIRDRRHALTAEINKIKQETVAETPTTEVKEEVEIKTETVDTQGRPAKAGARLFNDPNPETAEISAKYKQDKGIETSAGENITEIDIDNAMEIADAYEAMEDNPSNPEVQEAYNALAKETVDQYNAMTEAGYEIEIYEGKGEP